MAVITAVTAGDVGRILSGRDSTVVAARAGTDDLCVVNPVGGQPDHNIMAILTDIAGCNVVRRFAGGIGTVVTTAAVAHDAVVLKHRRNPAVGCMTGVAIVTAGNVGRVLTDRD